MRSPLRNAFLKGEKKIRDNQENSKINWEFNLNLKQDSLMLFQRREKGHKKQQDSKNQDLTTRIGLCRGGGDFLGFCNVVKHCLSLWVFRPTCRSLHLAEQQVPE
jgi:hypothetical protein